jgi:hypothetical protein
METQSKDKNPGRRKSSCRMNHVAISICLLVMGTLLPHSAQALSAFAAGIPNDVSSQGVALGAGYNYATRQGAEARALQECRKQVDAPETTRALCKIVAHFDNQCVVVSIDPQPGTPGFGWAIGANATAAESKALENCRQTAGPARTAYCEVSLTDCDTHTPPK